MRAHRPRPAYAGRMLSEAETVALLNACTQDPTHRGARDALIVALGVSAGLRRSEMCWLDTGDLIDAPDPPLEILIVGKRHRARFVYLYLPAMELLGRWMSFRGWHPGPLLTGSTPTGHIATTRLTGHGLWRALRRRQVQAAIAPFTPHDLRRTFISNLLQAEVDIALVARLAGHANITTTALYDRRPQHAARLAARQAQLPLPLWPAPDPMDPAHPDRPLGRTDPDPLEPPLSEVAHLPTTC